MMNKNAEGKKSNKKSTSTLAIDQNVLGYIKREAEAEGVSINSKINYVLKKYALFYKYTELEQPVILPSKTFSFLLDETDEQKMLEEYKYILLYLLPEALIRQNIPITFDNWVKYVFGSMVIYSGAVQAFEYYNDDEGLLCLVFRHKYGMKFSRLIDKAYTHALETLFGYHTICTLLPSSVVLKIRERNAADIVNR